MHFTCMGIKAVILDYVGAIFILNDKATVAVV